MKVGWVGTRDNYNAKVGNFILRCEKMDTQRWWWAVVKGGSRIGSGFEGSRDDAFKIAEEFYWGTKDVQ